MELRVATRGSTLSIRQTQIAIEHMAKRLSFKFKIIKVKTKGDVVRDRPLYDIGSKGVFEKEVNRMVLEGNADIAVHSLKDLPSQLDPRLEIVYVPPRGSPYEALVPSSSSKLPESLMDVPSGSVVGTSSLRRQALIRYYNPKAKVKIIRGNLDTRLKKLDGEGYDYIIVAEAGLERLRIRRPYLRLPLRLFPPAPGQGLIAVVALAGSTIAEKLKKLNDRVTWAVVEAEREFLKWANAGCHTPLGGVAVPYGARRLKLFGAILAKNGSKAIFLTISDDLDRARSLGRRAGELVNSIYDEVLEHE